MLPDLKDIDKRLVIGWIAVGVSTAITCFWAFWGIIENFHEGWYYESLLQNIGLMLVQYLSPMAIFMGISATSIRWHRLGMGLHVVLALFAVWFFHAFANPGIFFLMVPLIGIGALYWFGRPQPRRIALYLAIGMPILTLLVFGAKPVMQVSQRIDDGNLQARLVSGNGVDLT